MPTKSAKSPTKDNTVTTRVISGAEQQALDALDAIGVEARQGPPRELLDLAARTFKPLKDMNVKHGRKAQLFDQIDEHRTTPDGRENRNADKRAAYAAEQGRPIRAYRKDKSGKAGAEKVAQQKAESKRRIKKALSPAELAEKREAARLYMQARRRAAKEQT